MAKTFRCSIVTPSAAILDEEVAYASFPAWDGQMGMLPGRSPLLTRLGVGTLRIESTSGDSRLFLIDSGFAQVQENGLTLLTERAIPADQVNLQQAEAELAAANARVTDNDGNMAAVEHDQQLALAKKALASAGRSRG